MVGNHQTSILNWMFRDPGDYENLCFHLHWDQGDTTPENSQDKLENQPSMKIYLLCRLLKKKAIFHCHVCFRRSTLLLSFDAYVLCKTKRIHPKQHLIDFFNLKKRSPHLDGSLSISPSTCKWSFFRNFKTKQNKTKKNIRIKKNQIPLYKSFDVFFHNFPKKRFKTYLQKHNNKNHHPPVLPVPAVAWMEENHQALGYFFLGGGPDLWHKHPTVDGWNPANHQRCMKPCTLDKRPTSTGAGFLSSPVSTAF